MKTIFRTIIAASLALLMSMTLSAQPDGKRLSREELAVKQAEHISTELAFDDATAKKFKETYCDFYKELWALGPGLGKQQSENPSEEDMKQRFERSQKILDLRKKYYDTYSTFLTQKQISRVYEIERDMMRHLARQKSPGAKMNASLAKFLEEYETSCDGIFVLGGSMGGTGTWSLANTYPTKIRGIMPVAGKPGTADAANFRSMRVCTVMSESDEVMKTAYEDVKAFCENINGAGGNASCTIVPASERWSHQTTCEQAYTEERLRWLFGK